MLAIYDTTGITVKHTVGAADHVRIGVTQICLWVDGERRAVRQLTKPHVEFDGNDFRDLLHELDRLRS